MSPRDDELDKKAMTYRDLTLLMEGYRNNIELTTTLLEQQKQLLTQHDTMLKNQADLCKEIEELAKSLNQITKELKDDFISLKIDSTKEYSSIKHIFYVALIGGIALITVIFEIISNMGNKISSLSQMVTKLLGG